MTVETHFIKTINEGWIKGVPCLIPNLQEGQFVITMDDKSNNYRRWRWRIDKIETVIGSTVNTVVQDVYLSSCGPEEHLQEEN